MTGSVPVTVKLAAELSGLSEKGIRRKIERGDWRQGREYHRAPDGSIFVDLEGFKTWVMRGRKPPQAK